MCGIIGAIAQRDVDPVLIEGLRRLEYRGYDSAGIAVIDSDGVLHRERTIGKVAALADALAPRPLSGPLGIAHTRWATHGVPSEENAHPHLARVPGGASIAVVHNGIIENHEVLRARLEARGVHFASDTDSEVIAHLVAESMAEHGGLVAAVRAAAEELEGAFALGVVATSDPQKLVACRRGSPLLVGIGIGETFLASDVHALLPVTQRFIFLQDGDLAVLTRGGCAVSKLDGTPVQRPITESALHPDAVERGAYRHYMLKEIFEQPSVLADAVEGRVGTERVLDESLWPQAGALLEGISAVHLVACGTSYHAGLVARHWFESLAGVPVTVEVASEYRYRSVVVPPGTLLIALSQSGETADTLAAVEKAQGMGYRASLGVCNVAESSLVRACDLALMTRAGPEIGVASTKAFTTQLVSLLLVAIVLARRLNRESGEEARLVAELRGASVAVEHALTLSPTIEALAQRFVEREHALYLGRGMYYPIAMEGALKLKEISYIHAEAYPAGELKHGPLALIDSEMPVVVVAPKDDLIGKLRSNLQEVRARGGEVYMFADAALGLAPAAGLSVIPVQNPFRVLAPLVFTIPLQLLAYHVAVLRGTDVDQPRNLAKAVTVE